MGECTPVTTLLDTSIKLKSIIVEEAPANPIEYTRIVRELMFVAYVIRPDIAYAVG